MFYNPCVQLSSAMFGSPQSRKRVYILMVRKDLANDNLVKGICSHIRHYLHNAIPHRSTLKDVHEYVCKVEKDLGNASELITSWLRTNHLMAPNQSPLGFPSCPGIRPGWQGVQEKVGLCAEVQREAWYGGGRRHDHLLPGGLGLG